MKEIDLGNGMKQIVLTEEEEKDLHQILEQTKTVIYERFGIDVVKRNYWDSHGRLIPWTDDSGRKQKTIKNCHIKIVKVITKHHFKYSGDTETEKWEIYINGVKDNGDCYGYSQRDPKRINIKMIYGWG